MIRKLSLPFRFLAAVWKMIIIYLPGPIGNRLRFLHYRRRFRRCGQNVTIDSGVLIEGEAYISIGNNVHIDKYCVIQTTRNLQGRITRRVNPSYDGEEGLLQIGDDVHLVQFCTIMAHGGVRISNRCTLSAGVKVYSLSNLPADPEDSSAIISIMPYNQAPFLLAPVVLDENVWVGLNGLIMPGANIGANSFVISQSLVMGSHPPNSVLSGQPAHRIRARYQ